MNLRRRVLHAVYERDEFNALLSRPPRAIRGSVEPALLVTWGWSCKSAAGCPCRCA